MATPARSWSRGGDLLLAAALVLAPGLVAAPPCRAQVVLNEVHYHPPDRTERSEFIEILNAGREAADLSGWRLAGGVRFAFPSGTSLAPGAHLVVARSPVHLRARLGAGALGAEALGPWEGKLSRSGERLVLEDAAGAARAEIDFRLGFPWPTVGDPPGRSIELVHPSLDASLGGSWRPGGPTPGKRNSVWSEAHPPQVLHASHEPRRPRSGQPVRVTVLAADPDGISRAVLESQVVDPGKYIARPDPEYAKGWTAVPMARAPGDGLGKGAVAFTVEIPGSLQVHRRLVRYRITLTDAKGLALTVPYREDPQPNFAWFVHDGVPPWRGAIHATSPDPARSRLVEFSPQALTRVPVYHLLSRRESIEAATWHERYAGSEYLWWGTLVHEGEVHDHVRYRARGGSWRYAMGKNMWKVDFNRGHAFQAADEAGRPYRERWTKLNLGACIQQGEYGHRGEQGLFESVGFRLFEMAGVEAPRTHWVHLRIVTDHEEYTNQYRGDFWGLYLALEQMDDRFLEEHGLPAGNLFKMESGTGTLEARGPEGPSDGSDLARFMEAYQRRGLSDAWWRENLDLPRYYSYRSIVECIHHYDIDEAAGKNYYYFRDPASGRWSVHPWDIDLTWADGMYGGGESPFKRRVLSRPAFALEYQNRLRELRDLLYNPEQTGRLIDERARIIHDPSLGPTLAEADRALWDYHPALADPARSFPRKAGHGRFYRASPTRDFPGMARLMKEYVERRGAWIDEALLRDDRLPEAPRVSRGEGLRFRASPYRGREPFAAIRWRAAEPYPEIRAAWESAELGEEGLEVSIPPERLPAGRTYRVRARVKDRAGRWSRWSDPVEAAAGG